MRTRTSRAPQPASVLERLEDGEAQALLHRLLAAHSDLRADAERMARALLGEVRCEAVADDVEDALRALTLDDLGRRAGRHRGGYTSPTEAAWELLQGAVDPFLADLKRRMERGLERETLEIGKGILLGLYRIRDPRGDEFLGWAEGFPAEAAADAVRVLAGGNEWVLPAAWQAPRRADRVLCEASSFLQSQRDGERKDGQVPCPGVVDRARVDRAVKRSPVRALSTAPTMP